MGFIMFKKIISIFLILSLLFSVTACSGDAQSGDGDKINIVCTTFAAYDWTREIVRDNKAAFDITLLGGGADLHSFQPTTRDIAKIHTADLFVQIGGTTEEWTKELNLGDRVLRLFDLLDDTEKLCIKSPHMQLQFSEDNYDEHIWLSLRLAQRMTNEICKRICDLDEENGVQYRLNCANYIEELKKLDEKYQSVVNNSDDKTVIFADRFPFAYLMNDYDITCFSAFDGCSSDADASFNTVADLSQKVKKYDKKTVLVLENSNESVVQPLKSALSGASLDVAVINSCQSLAADTEGYIDIMTDNLNSLEKALR